jgi:hypothetical protein
MISRVPVQVRSRIDLITAPSSEPITATEVKTQLRITATDEDTYINNLITTARQFVEELTGISFLTQTWEQSYDIWPFPYVQPLLQGVYEGTLNFISQGFFIELPRRPLVSVTYIKTYDLDDTATTISASDYLVSAYAGTNPDKGRISLKAGVSITGALRSVDAVKIKFVSGWTAAANVPYVLRQALLEEVSFRYMNRGDCSDPIQGTKRFLNNLGGLFYGSYV